MGTFAFARKFCNIVLDTHFVEPQDLHPGDHVYSYRTGHIYSHQGIVEGKDEHGVIRIIHFRDLVSKTFSMACSNQNDGESCFLVFSTDGSGVVSSCVDCFRKGHHLHLYHYSVSDEDFSSKRPGTCTTEEKDELSRVVKRAQALLRTNGFGEFDLLSRNCENFSLYCCTGKSLPSNQVKVFGLED